MTETLARRGVLGQREQDRIVEFHVVDLTDPVDGFGRATGAARFKLRARGQTMVEITEPPPSAGPRITFRATSQAPRRPAISFSSQVDLDVRLMEAFWKQRSSPHDRQTTVSEDPTSLLAWEICSRAATQKVR